MAARISPERLTAAMAHAGITTDAELARRLGMGRLSPGQWKRGEATPAGDTIDKLCRVLGVTPAYLFGEEEPSAPDELALLIARLHADERAKVAGYVRGLLDAREPVIGDPAADPRVAAQLAAARKPPSGKPPASGAPAKAAPTPPAPSPGATHRPRR